MPYKTELSLISPGEHFYFPNDPEMNVWKKTKEKRRTKGKQVFFCCESHTGMIEDFGANRFIMAFEMNGEIIPKQLEYKKQVPAIIKADRPVKIITPINSEQKNTNSMHNIVSNHVKVFESTEYKRFVKINGNRDINTAKVKRIIKEIAAGNDMLEYYPILVEEAGKLFNVLDGQHRLEIDKTLKRPVFYIVVKQKKQMADIAKVNSNVEKWKSANYINCYLKSGNENYRLLDIFIDTYGFSIGVCLSLLSNGAPGKASGGNKNLQKDFELGIYEVKQYQAAVSFADLCKRFNFFSNWRSRDFVIAIYKIHTAALYNFDDIVTAVTHNAKILTQQANFKEYIFKIEQIVNIGKKNRVIIA